MAKPKINSFEQLAEALKEIINPEISYSYVFTKDENQAYVSDVNINIDKLKSIFSRITFNYNGKPKQSDSDTNL